MERLRDQVSPHLMITEIRAIAADDLWLSPCYEQPWKQDWTAVSKLLPVIEKELAPFHARPHWGKLFTTSPAELKGIYTKMPEFIELSRKYDPQGKFRNAYLNKNIFGN
jgi:xylitol oxidase